MDWNRVEGNWKQVKGKVKEKWGQLTDDDLASINGKRIPIDGGGRQAENEQTYNYQDSRPHPSRDGTVVPYWGTSIVLAVSFEGDRPKAQGFLTYSQSSDPKSPYAADQTERFSRKEWITYPFTDAEIKADPAYSINSISQ